MESAHATRLDRNASPAGVVLTLLVAAVYVVVINYEKCV
jgi:hypothetical protein